MVSLLTVLPERLHQAHALHLLSIFCAAGTVDMTQDYDGFAVTFHLRADDTWVSFIGTGNTLEAAVLNTAESLKRTNALMQGRNR